MKSNISKTYPLLLFIILLTIISCKKSDIEHENDFNKSYKSWTDFKKTSQNTYQYTVVAGTWAGYSWQTQITVTEGKIKQRYFKYISTRDISFIPEMEREWTEDEDKINSHQNTNAAEALTLDQIYTKARNEYLIKRENATTIFEAKNNGLISSCGFIDDGCQDDCFRGITISSIETL